MQGQFEAVMQDVQLDEKTAHEECPDDTKGAFLHKMKGGMYVYVHNEIYYTVCRENLKTFNVSI